MSVYAGKAGGAACAFVAETAGADENIVKTARVVGTVAGSAELGIMVGELMMGGVVDAVGAVAGLHGAAAIAHGEKVVGSVIGGGQAAGKVIAAAVDVSSSVTSVLDGVAVEQDKSCQT